MVNPATIPLTADERAILQILADASEPLDSFTIFSAVAPPPETRDARRREHRLWRERQLELTGAEIALWKARFLVDAVPADGFNPYRCAVTEDGLKALAADPTTRSESNA